VAAGGKAGNVGTGGTSSERCKDWPGTGGRRPRTPFCPSISIDRRRITASMERPSRLLGLWLAVRVWFGVTLLLARKAGCMRSDEWSSFRRTASGSGWEAVLLLLAALIRACNSSAATNLGFVVGASSGARGLEKCGKGADVSLGDFVVAIRSFSLKAAGMLLCLVEVDIIGSW
jgi:hypothetical protein